MLGELGIGSQLLCTRRTWHGGANLASWCCTMLAELGSQWIIRGTLREKDLMVRVVLLAKKKVSKQMFRNACTYVAVHLSCLTGPLLGSDESTPPAPLWCLILLCWPPRCERRSLHLPPVHIWTSKRGMVIVTHPVLHSSSPFVMTTSSDDSVGISPAKPLAS